MICTRPRADRFDRRHRGTPIIRTKPGWSHRIAKTVSGLSLGLLCSTSIHAQTVEGKKPIVEGSQSGGIVSDPPPTRTDAIPSIDRPEDKDRGRISCRRGRCGQSTSPAGGGRINGAVALAAFRRPMRLSGAYRAIETRGAAAASGAVIDGLVADDLQRGGVRLRGKLSNITIRNSSFRFRAAPQVAPHLPACLEVGDKTAGTKITGILIQNVTCEGFQMVMAKDRYWNGDGPTFEANVSGLVLDNVTSRNSTDGCFDIKPAARATRIEAEGCKRNVRLWRDFDADQVTSITPIKRGGTGSTTHLWIHGNNAAPPAIHIRKLIVRSTNMTPILTIEDGAAHVTIDACDIRVPPGTPFKIGGAEGNVLALGPGCTARRVGGI